jgi:3-oxoacyl-[acyl-carrier protein] reductase
MEDRMTLSGRRILVTGATRGIGRAVAEACLDAGAGVVGVNYVRSDDAAAELVARFGRRVRPLRFDVGDPAAVAAGVAAFAAEDASPIDGLVNNAGISRPKLLISAGVEDLLEQVRVNVTGTLLCSRAVIGHMVRTRTAGAIVNIGSVAAARPVSGQAAYAASKGAVEALTRVLAVEYGRRGIRVNCVSPGVVATGLQAAVTDTVLEAARRRSFAGRFATAEEVARVVVRLLADESRYVTGTSHTIDGGYLLT